MYSIAFPKMFKTAKTILYKDHEAIKSNLQLLIASEKKSLFGDPYFGAQFKTIIFEQNNSIVKDIVIDELYTCILLFLPQIYVERKDIEIYSTGVDLYAKVKCKYYLDATVDLYEINLTASNEK